ncbi:single-stranded DNA-binding protein [Streptomyces sp. RB6PN25]|uniref:Single-stranded DNA-binding protein n=1 Tax=Streptomyces humicola TaxID=2953240 RepID=A0ABT1PW03_9ACTN|nr:single-stranded DNA-binding protein [Streptomyces humicola]MCQ4081854.1 single-stranded DNA-binding protein [Streptomyces humicola]
MSETLVTVVGNVATQPMLKNTVSGVPMARFRLATTERRWDRVADRWTDGHTSFFTVWAYRMLGENLAASLGVGEPVIVQGRLRVLERDDKREEKGQISVTVAIEAVAVGHDLSRGTAAFRRVVRARPELVEPQPQKLRQQEDAAPDEVPEPVPG